MRKLKISRTDLELAFELSSYETTAYLDTETGAVIFVEDYVADQLEELLADEVSEDVESVLQAHTDLADIDRQQLLDAARVEGDADNRYRMIPKQDSRDGYRGCRNISGRWKLSICENCSKLLSRVQARFGALRMCCLVIPKPRKSGSDSVMSAKTDA